MSDPFFVIVDEGSVTSRSLAHVGGSGRIEEVVAEIEKIKKGIEGVDWIPVDVNNNEKVAIPEGIPRDRAILVGGAYYTGAGHPWCVNFILDALKMAGYAAQVHMPATLQSNYVF